MRIKSTIYYLDLELQITSLQPSNIQIIIVVLEDTNKKYTRRFYGFFFFTPLIQILEFFVY